MRFPLVFALIAGLIVFSEVTLGHGTESHVEESQAVEQSPATSPVVISNTDDQLTEAQQPQMDDHPEDVNEQDHATTEGLSSVGKSSTPPKPGPMLKIGKAIEDFTHGDFPTLHPMVVHVPVIMIPVAFLFGIISLFFNSRLYVGLAVAFASAGVLGGYIAAFPMHPHTRGLSEAATKVLLQHDFFAYSTLSITAISVLIGAFTLFKPGFLSKGLLAVVLLIASLCVSVTAHYGGTLTYIHGVGVNGNYLDEH